MVAIPLMEETAAGPSGAMIANLAGLSRTPADLSEVSWTDQFNADRRLSIYPSSAGFELIEELDFLSARTIEPNIFFNPRFLAPAMPRLEDRDVRLAVIRDGDDLHSRLRLLVPFSVEKPAISLGVTVMRTWSSPFGPLGTPLIDRDDPVSVLQDFFNMLSRPHLKLPKVLVLPDMRLEGPVAGLVRMVALERNLPVHTATRTSRAFLESSEEPDDYLRRALSSHHFREFRRLKRRLADKGELVYHVARQADEIRLGLETFLTLEASGWKGRAGTAMVIDRFRAAFAREAVHRLSQHDLCRIHSLQLDGRTIASLIVFIEAGVAYTWKTAYDEAWQAWSPGTLLAVEVTRNHLEDPNIVATDSCAHADHPVMNRIWTERREMGAMVIGLTPGSDRAARQAAKQLHLYRETRNMARIVRERVKGILGRG
ncbi:MAG: GNAT family N-acetyltransferase [Rhizobiaceae bacterium]